MTEPDNATTSPAEAPASPGASSATETASRGLEINPRSVGHSPAQDARDRGQVPAERTINIRGVDYAEAALNDMITRAVAEDSRRASLPSDPNGYQAKFNDSFVEPAGLHFDINEDHPATRQAIEGARAFAHKAGLTQEQFSELIELYAGTQYRALSEQQKFIEGEIKKLGSAGPARIDAVGTWLHQKLGPELSRIVLATLATEGQVRAWENVIQLFSNQGGGSYSATGREGQDEPGKIPGYESMTYEERRGYQLNLEHARMTPKR